jgi:hypothetical protein
MTYFQGRFDGVHHKACGGDIRPHASEGERTILCEKCDWSYRCESLERPIHAVYRLIDMGVLVDDENDNGGTFI